MYCLFVWVASSTCCRIRCIIWKRWQAVLPRQTTLQVSCSLAAHELFTARPSLTYTVDVPESLSVGHPVEHAIRTRNFVGYSVLVFCRLMVSNENEPVEKSDHVICQLKFVGQETVLREVWLGKKVIISPLSVSFLNISTNAQWGGTLCALSSYSAFHNVANIETTSQICPRADGVLWPWLSFWMFCVIMMLLWMNFWIRLLDQL